jgi:hypothetical protein
MYANLQYGNACSALYKTFVVGKNSVQKREQFTKSNFSIDCVNNASANFICACRKHSALGLLTGPRHCNPSQPKI